MNYRTLKNGTRIEEPKFQAYLEMLRRKNPGKEITELDALARLNNARDRITHTKTVLQHPGDSDVELKPVKPRAPLKIK